MPVICFWSCGGNSKSHMSGFGVRGINYYVTNKDGSITIYKEDTIFVLSSSKIMDTITFTK